jgi:hypothetical protein
MAESSMVEEQIIAELASIILEEFNEDPYINIDSFRYKLPFEKIDNIPVIADLHITKSRKCITFFIHSGVIYNFGNHMYYKKSISYNDIRRYKYTVEDFIDAINKVMQLVKEIRFNKLNGKLSTKCDISIRKKNAFMQLFNFEHVQLTYSECSICGDHTMTKTKCNHPLCYGCQEQIKETQFSDEDDDTFATQDCPICRKIINKRQLNVDKLVEEN